MLLLLFVAAAGVVGLMLRFGGRAEQVPEPAPATAEAPGGDLVLPVAGVQPAQLTDTWGQAREGGAREHHAIDIMAPRGTPVVAAAPGRIEKIFESKPGGHTLYVRSADGRTVYYYAHLDAYREGLGEGQRVRPGDLIGTVGSSGNASPEGPHLHFEVKRMASGEGWWQGRNVNPYPLLAGKPTAR
nr:M23 family metallopeptidase [Sphingomonas sp. ID1715]